MRRQDDPLLNALLWLCRHHGVEVSAHALLDGHSADAPLTPTQSVEALRRVGFSASLVRRPPSRILSLLMPVVVVLQNGDACIVRRRIDGAKGQAATYELVMPSGLEGLGESCMATEAELMAEHSGYTLIAAVKSGARQAGREAGELGSDHWFWSTMRRLLPYYRSSMLAALLSNVLMLFVGLFTSVVYDRVIPNQAFVTLWSLATGVFVAIAFDMTARQLRSHLLDVAGKKADLSLGSRLFAQALGIRLEHRPDSAGAFAHRMAQIEVVRDFSASASISVVSDLPFILLFILATWAVAGPLVVVLLVAVPVILGMTWAIQSLLRRHMRLHLNQQADLHGVLIEAMEGLEDVRAAGAQGFFRTRYDAANAAAAVSTLRHRRLTSWVNNMSTVSQQLITVVMLVWGVHLIAAGQLSSGALIAAVMFAGRALAPLGSIVGLASRYQTTKAALLSLNHLMGLPLEREPGRQYLSPGPLQGQMALREVSFAYPKGTREHSPTVLKGVNLLIRPGERVAILGRIGSGKSTILRLLAGLYQPGEGMVEVDGLDLRQIDPVDFRAQVGFVSQEPRLFTGTLKDNVFLGRSHADPEQFLAVARLTGLDRVAAAHPLGYDMPVGEMGALLSGGQRQLVALARCLVTQPQVLLMDEPTSSMDAQAEGSFIHHLRTAVGDRTLVVVTHRPALLDVVDRVIVVDGGKVLADGPKAQVMAALAGRPQPSGDSVTPLRTGPGRAAMGGP